MRNNKYGMPRLIKAMQTPETIPYKNDGPLCLTGKGASSGRFALAWIFFLIWLGLALFCKPANAGRAYLETETGFQSGDFGTTIDSSLFYVGTRLGFLTPDMDINVTVPYLYQTYKTGNVRETTSGIGDIVLRGSGYLVSETDGGFSLTGTLALKLPTADKNKGLGTGEADYGGFLTANQNLSDFTFSLMSGLIVVGDTKEEDFGNLFLYGVGVSRQFEQSELYLSLEGSQTMIMTTDNPLVLNLGFFHLLGYDYSLKGNLALGLSNGAADYGGDVSLVRFF
ncbi:MAG: hypothetical protein GXP53_06575 [Deltaproteobacteria bacterium]|nr:hypothetical protein [Deltaproteobacteria bacterium]